MEDSFHLSCGTIPGQAAASRFPKGATAMRPRTAPARERTHGRRFSGRSSTAVGRMGRVEAPKGLRLRAGPSAGAATMAILPFDTLVHVERKTEHGWYYVVSMGDARGGASVTGAGCVEGQHVELVPPEPTAHLHFVKPGEMLKDIAAQHYKPRRGFEWGADARLHVEAIWEANKSTGKLIRVGGDLSWDESLVRSDKQEKTLDIWRSVQPKHNHAIWIPSQTFVDALDKAGAISGGSISHAAWQTAQQAAQALVDFAQYRAGYVVGVLEGVFAAARDLVMGVVDLLGLVHDLLKLLITEGLVGAAQSIGGKLVELFKHAPDLLAQAGAWFVKNWTQKDDFDRGEFQGEVVGYVLAQVLLAIVTMGESVALQATGRFASFIKVVRALDASADILTYARGAARTAKLPAEALARLRKASGRADDALETAADAGGTISRSRAPEAGPAGSDQRPTADISRPPTADIAHPAVARRTPAQRTALAAELPTELRGDIPIVESEALQGAAVHVVYKDGDLRIEVGPDAEPRHVRHHVATARHLLKFQGPLGSVRRLLDAILTKLKLTPGYGTKGFEARLEVRKLLAIQTELEQLRARLDGRVQQLSRDPAALDARQLDRELAEIQEQLELHQRSVDSYDPGRGFVAAEGRGNLPEYAIRRADMFEEIVESGRNWFVSYKARTSDGREVEWGVTHVELDEHGNARSGPENTLKARFDHQGTSHAAHFYDEVGVPGTGGPPVGKGQRISATRYALERSMELYRRRFGHAPDTLNGLLAWDNKLNFQLEWVRLRELDPNLPDEETAIAAVRNISFGKHRIALGFDQFKVDILESSTVHLPGYGPCVVPIRIYVEVRKRR